MRIFLFSVLILLSSLLSAQHRSYLPAYKGGQVVKKSFYTLSYSEKHEQPAWVAYDLSAAQTTGTVKRTNNYRSDPSIRTGSAELTDYRRSGYDRGHLVPAGDMKFDARAMSETFFLSNMSPQRNDFNGGVWLRLEEQVRRWVQQRGQVMVIAGPIFRPNHGKIGENEVWVPAYFYKIVYDPDPVHPEMIAFLLPHLPSKAQLPSFAVTVDELETSTGIDFFSQLPDSLEDKLESGLNSKPWFEPGASTIARIRPDEAGQHIGEMCIVCGTVADTYYNPSSSNTPTFLNLEKAFPNSPLTVVIYQDSRANFPYAPEKALLGKRICIKGRVGLYRNRLQIRIYHPRQLLSVEPEAN
ncbi:MAG: DNA/RNA non-specific endonuclease [Bacteroidota bacterium]